MSTAVAEGRGGLGARTAGGPGSLRGGQLVILLALLGLAAAAWLVSDSGR